MGWAGRRLCRPPAGDGGLGAPLPGRWGRRWGAFFESAEGGAAGSEIGALPGGRRGRCGPRGLDPYREVGGLEGREGGWRPRVASMFVAVVALDRLDNKPPASEVKKMAKQNGDGSGSGA